MAPGEQLACSFGYSSPGFEEGNHRAGPVGENSSQALIGILYPVSPHYNGVVNTTPPRPIDTGGIPFAERALTQLLLRPLGPFFSVPRMTRWSSKAIREIERLAEVPDAELSRRTTIQRILAIEES